MNSESIYRNYSGNAKEEKKFDVKMIDSVIKNWRDATASREESANLRIVTKLSAAKKSEMLEIRCKHSVL